MMQTKVRATDHPLQYQEVRGGTSCTGWLSTRRIRASPAAEPALADHRCLKETISMPITDPAVTPKAGLPDEVYEGTVKLDVDSEGGILQLVHFVRQLRELPQVRLLRLVGNHQVMEILLSLREPLTLEDTLVQIRGVTQVSAPKNPGALRRAVTAPSACDLQGDTGMTTPPHKHRAALLRSSIPGASKGGWAPFRGGLPDESGPSRWPSGQGWVGGMDKDASR